jgi:hypothetical protein
MTGYCSHPPWDNWQISSPWWAVCPPCGKRFNESPKFGLAGNVGVMSGIPPPQNNRHADMSGDMSRHVAQHGGNIKPCWLLRCRANVVLAWQSPDMFAHVRKKTTNSTMISCNNQIIMAVAAAWWRLGRCVGWPLKVVEVLGRSGSGGRWAMRALTLTLCNENGGRRAWTSNLTINYFKQRKNSPNTSLQGG